MSTRTGPFSAFTTDQLLEELVRRRNARIRSTPHDWCHDCAHFKPAPHLSERQLEKYNPCCKQHSMDHWFPQPHEDPHVGGYYRRVCPDRSPIP